jgi:hypothetical protein
LLRGSGARHKWRDFDKTGRRMPRVSPLLLAAVLLAACARGGDDAARAPSSPTKVPGGAVADASARSSYQLDAPAIAEVGNLCLFRPRKEPVMQGHRDRTGASWEGEIRVRDVASFETKWLSPSDKRVAAVVARPKVETFRVRIDDNCYDAARRSYYACSKVLEADVSRVRGFARAPTVPEARALAVQLCEKKVAEMVEAAIDVKQDNQDLQCRVVDQAWCDLPPVPAPPTAPAKKK